MVLRILFTFTVLVFFACKDGNSEKTTEESKPEIASIKTDRFTVPKGNMDSIQLSSYKVENYKNEQVDNSIYYAADGGIQMKFTNDYENGQKTRVNWINASDTLVMYVTFTYGEDGRLMRTENYRPDGTYKNGFEHQWNEDGTEEAKGPIIDTLDFKPNAIYYYNEKNDQIRLVEYDENDSLIYNGYWKYLDYDDNGNWLERTVTRDDTLRRIEKRTITYNQ